MLSKTILTAAAMAVLLTAASFGLSQKRAGAQPTVGGVVAVRPVKVMDDAALRLLIKPNGKPLMINFWATWCEPCREEFPDLVLLDGEFRGKIDFIVISLDDLAEIDRDVPKFLAEMKAEMPAYLLKTPDESAAIAAVSKGWKEPWKGGLPLTVLYAPNGDVAYLRQGLINIDVVRSRINSLTAPAPMNQ